MYFPLSFTLGCDELGKYWNITWIIIASDKVFQSRDHSNLLMIAVLIKLLHAWKNKTILPLYKKKSLVNFSQFWSKKISKCSAINFNSGLIVKKFCQEMMNFQAQKIECEISPALDILFRQITAFIKVRMAFVFGL